MTSLPADSIQVPVSEAPHKQTRRQFLQAAVAAPLIVGLQPAPAAAAVLRPNPVAPDTQHLPAGLSPDEVSILSYAALAPSGHNTQPWTVSVMDRGHWRIGSERQRWLPAVDPANRETMLSIGAFMENLMTAAHATGYGIEYTVIARAATDAQLIDLHLHKDRTAEYPMARLTTRRTVRGGYEDTRIKIEDLRAVTGRSKDFIYFARDTAPARFLAQATIEANRKQAYRDAAQAELANWIRWSKAEQEGFRNGLTPAGMEITGLAGWYVSTFYNRESALKKGFRETGIQQVVERVAQGAGWLVMTGTPGVAGWIESGRLFQRMWLKLRERTLAIHPMTQLLEETPGTQTITRALGIDGVPQFILRVGYVRSYPDPVSPRMPVSAFTRNA